MSCKHCGHDIFDHQDRALAACAPELPTRISYHPHKSRFPRSSNCYCPGYEAVDADR